jgi:hypothetical protein
MRNTTFFNSYYELLNNKVSSINSNLLLNVTSYVKDTSNNSGK